MDEQMCWYIKLLYIKMAWSGGQTAIASAHTVVADISSKCMSNVAKGTVCFLHPLKCEKLDVGLVKSEQEASQVQLKSRHALRILSLSKVQVEV